MHSTCIMNALMHGMILVWNANMNLNLMFQNERVVRRVILPGHLPDKIYIVPALTFVIPFDVLVNL